MCKYINLILFYLYQVLKSNLLIHYRVRKIMIHLLIVGEQQLLTEKMNTDKKVEG